MRVFQRQNMTSLTSLTTEKFHELLFGYLNSQYRDLSRHDNSKTIFFGVSAPQGCGKTTITNKMKSYFQKEGLKCISMSLDDFYLTGEEQDILSEKYMFNPLLKHRGNAGTHSLTLLLDTIAEIEKATENDVVCIPRYDKYLRNGRGDRSPWELWSKEAGPIDVVLLEGWMFGFGPIGRADLENAKHKYPGIENVNDNLMQYQKINQRMDSWIILSIEEEKGQSNVNSDVVFDGERIYKWRGEAEISASKKGLSTLSPEEVRDFVDRFMPAYQVYLPFLYTHGPDFGNWNREFSEESQSDVSVLKVIVDENRAAKSFWSLQ